MTHSYEVAVEGVALDIYVHQNPGLCAWIVYWAIKGHELQSKKMTGHARGLLLPWAMLAAGLVATKASRDVIPDTAGKQLGTMVNDLDDVLPGGAAPTIRSWATPTWRGIAFAADRGILEIERGVLTTSGRMSKADASDHAQELKKKAQAFGKIIAKEPSNATIAAAFNVEVEP